MKCLTSYLVREAVSIQNWLLQGGQLLNLVSMIGLVLILKAGFFRSKLTIKLGKYNFRFQNVLFHDLKKHVYRLFLDFADRILNSRLTRKFSQSKLLKKNIVILSPVNVK